MMIRGWDDLDFNLKKIIYRWEHQSTMNKINNEYRLYFSCSKSEYLYIGNKLDSVEKNRMIKFVFMSYTRFAQTTNNRRLVSHFHLNRGLTYQNVIDVGRNTNYLYSSTRYLNYIKKHKQLAFLIS